LAEVIKQWRTEDTAEKSQVGWTGAATAGVLVDHTALEGLGERHGQQHRLVVLPTSRLQRHHRTNRHTITADVTRDKLGGYRKHLKHAKKSTLGGGFIINFIHRKNLIASQTKRTNKKKKERKH